MAPPPRWAFMALSALTGISLLFLAVQYFLGQWTASYAPSTFTTNTSYPSLDWHYMIGYALGLLALLVLILAGVTRRIQLIGPALVFFLAVLGAGSLGMMYVRSSPNNPIDSFGMGVLFLFAFGSAMGLSFQLMRWRGRAWPGQVSAAPTPTG